MLLGCWRCHLHGAAGQVWLCAPAPHPVDPEAVLLTKGLQAAKGEEQWPASAQAPETLPYPTPMLGPPTRVSLPALHRAEPYLELGSFSFMFQSFLWMHRVRRLGGACQTAGLWTPHPIIPALPATPWQDLELGVLP